jgi:hypothetical protein
VVFFYFIISIIIAIFRIASGYTMDVICSTSFGMQVNSQKEKENQFVTHARKAMTTEVKAITMLLPSMY